MLVLARVASNSGSNASNCGNCGKRSKDNKGIKGGNGIKGSNGSNGNKCSKYSMLVVVYAGMGTNLTINRAPAIIPNWHIMYLWTIGNIICCDVVVLCDCAYNVICHFMQETARKRFETSLGSVW